MGKYEHRKKFKIFNGIEKEQLQFWLRGEKNFDYRDLIPELSSRNDSMKRNVIELTSIFVCLVFSRGLEQTCEVLVNQNAFNT